MPDALDELRTRLAAQRKAFALASYPTVDERRKNLLGLRSACAFVRDKVPAALAADFGSHDPSIGLLWELGGVLGRIRFTSDHLEKWMEPVPREVDPLLGDARAYVRYQPKGVVGNMAPWNFPIDISLGPLVDILAAGNRAIVKPSECAPHCAELVSLAVKECFDPDLVAVVCGDVELAKGFAGMPWDHLMYTGNPAVGRVVMAAAAANLTPVTLELGGKCPTIVLPDRTNADTYSEILAVKAVKSGQVCINTDYVLCPATALESMISEMQGLFASMFPSFVDGPSSTGIISERHFDRLIGYLAEATERGARVIPLGNERPIRANRTIPFTLVIDPPDDLKLMQEEIFGPILPIVTYRTVDDAIAYVNERDRPLALYVFTDDANAADDVLARTTSGGACVNAIATHASLPSLPFGGIGTSGMGAHHGYEGFQTFSHARAVFRRGAMNAWEMMRPPWGEPLAAITNMILDQP
ncbi:MAG TPA: aldehyde dehydrogenase family protein [Polyangiaceae bacterium]|jgi:coniferyl-aldehyde dehydrogenase|nr:aldehyde dehydrogenase family protein [Polyangiaceae bacterium]